MRNPIPGVRRRARRLVRGDIPLKVGSYVAPKGLRPLRPDEIAASDAFHRAYYDSWEDGSAHGRGTITLSWFGYRTLKSPLDLWTYQEILVEPRPDLVVECGTRFGGGAYYIATLLDLIGHGQVVTVDIEALKGRPVHRRISYLLGSSTDPAIVGQVRGTAAGKRVMVILDCGSLGRPCRRRAGRLPRPCGGWLLSHRRGHQRERQPRATGLWPGADGGPERVPRRTRRLRRRPG